MDNIKKYIYERPGQTMVALGVCLIIVKLIRFSHGSTDMAMALLQAAGPVNLVTAELVLISKTLISCLFLTCLVTMGYFSLKNVNIPRWLQSATVLSLFVLFTALPFPMDNKVTGGIAASAVAMISSGWVLVRFRSRGNAQAQAWSLKLKNLGYISIFIALVGSIFLSGTWVPSEFVTFDQSIGTESLSRQRDISLVNTRKSAVVGGVLGVRDGYMLLMRANPVTLLQIPENSVVGRQICSSGSVGKTLFDRIVNVDDGGGVPSCSRPYGQVSLTVRRDDDPNKTFFMGYGSRDNRLLVYAEETVQFKAGISNDGDQPMSHVHYKFGYALHENDLAGDTLKGVGDLPYGFTLVRDKTQRRVEHSFLSIAPSQMPLAMVTGRFSGPPGATYQVAACFEGDGGQHGCSRIYVQVGQAPKG